MANDLKKPDGNDIEIRPNGDEIDFTSESKLLKWLDNYWYHYKWHTIISLFVIILVIFIVSQQAGDPKQDTVVTYCGSYGFLAEETEDLREALNRIMPEDFDGNGEKYTEIVRYQFFSEEELIADKEANDGKGTVNLAYNAKQLSDFNSFVSFGECSIYILSEDMYEYFKANKSELLKPLADIVGKTPEKAYDEYAIRLKDTPYYAMEPALRKLPEDTLICMTAPFYIGSSSDPEIYADSLAMFRAIVTGK